MAQVVKLKAESVCNVLKGHEAGGLRRGHSVTIFRDVLLCRKNITTGSPALPDGVFHFAGHRSRGS
jgi:hypothetical protein